MRQRNGVSVGGLRADIVVSGRGRHLPVLAAVPYSQVTMYMKIHVTIAMSFPNGKSLFMPRLL